VLHARELTGQLYGYDPDGAPIRITHINGQAVAYGEAISLPSGGSLTIFADGTFSYTPPPNFVGSDSFSLTISDDLDSYTAMVNIQVTNNAPYAYDASFSVLHDRELTGWLYGYDADGDAIAAQLLSGRANGTLTLDPDGTFTYVPNPGYVGADSFTYTWSDGFATSELASVQIGVYNNPPTAQGEFFMLEPGQTFAVFLGDSTPPDYQGAAITLATLLDNDWDPDGDSLELVLVSTLSGYWQFNEALNAWVFSPPPEFEGTDASFEYFVTDTIYAASCTVALALQVGDNAGAEQGGNDAPRKLNLERTLYRGSAEMRIVNAGQPDPENDNAQGKVNFVSFDVDFTQLGFAYIVFDVNDTCCTPCQCQLPCGCGVWEFWIELFVTNGTPQAAGKLSVELGFGVDEQFTRSAANDGLDFDWPDKDTRPDDGTEVLVQYGRLPDGRPDLATVVAGTQTWNEDFVEWSGMPQGRKLKPIAEDPLRNQFPFFVAIDIPNYNRQLMPEAARTNNGYQFTLRLDLR